MAIMTGIDKIKQHKKVLSMVAVVIIVLAAVLYTLCGKTGSMPKTPELTAVDMIVPASGETVRQELVSQQLTAYELTLRFEMFEREHEGTICVALYADDHCEQEWEMKLDQLAIRSPHVFRLNQPVDFSESGRYYFTVTQTYEGDDNAVGMYIANASESGTLYHGDRVMEDQALVYRVAYKADIAKGLDLYKTLLVCAMGLLVIALAYAVIFTKIKKHTVFAALVLLIGFCYSVSITPLSVPDEPHHYQSSYQLSNYLVMQGDNPEQGDSSHFSYYDVAGHHNVPSAYVRIFKEFGRSGIETGEMIDIPLPRKLSYFVEYIPQAVGIAVGRLLGRNFITIFMLGRWCNLLFYAVCVYFAVKRVPRFKMPLGLLAIAPMALHQAASYSYDGFVNGLAFLLIASILKILLSDKKATISDFVWITVSVALMAPAKVVYCPILLILFLVDKRKFGSMKRKLLVIGCIVLVCAIMIGIFQLPSMLEIGSRGENKLNQEGEHNYTLSYVLHHPFKTVKILVDTLTEKGYNWLANSFGMYMSGLNLQLPSWIIPCYILTVLLSNINTVGESPLLKKRERLWVGLFTFGMIMLVIMSMFLAWTSNTRLIVQGVQGRYFIPLLPLLLLMINNNVVVSRRKLDRVLVIAAALLNMAAVENVLEYTIKR